MINKTEPNVKVNDVASSVSEAALEVLSEKGAGLQAEIYEECFFQAFKIRGLRYKKRVAMPVKYDGITVDNAYIIDILVEDSVIVKMKPAGSKPSLYLAHVSTYLKHSGLKMGMLLDFDSDLPQKCVYRVTA